MTIRFLVFVLIGELFVYLGMKFPPFSESRFSFVRRLWNCGLCSGCWVYSILGILFRVDLDFFTLTGIYPIDCFIIGCSTSFLVHIFSIGWDTKFSIIEIK